MSDKIKLIRRGPGEPENSSLVKYGIYTIGSGSNNRIILSDPDVCEQHAVLTLMPDESYVEKLAEGAVVVNGAPLEVRQRVFPADLIKLGRSELRFELASEVSSTVPQKKEPEPSPEREPNGQKEGNEKSEIPAVRKIKRQIHHQLLKRLDLKRLTVNRIKEDELQKRIRKMLDEIIAEVSSKLPSGINRTELAKEIYNEAVGLGPLEDLLEESDITEIMVNGPSQIYVERQGRLEKRPETFIDRDSVRAVIERIVSPIGRRIDESQPYVDARLADGSRVNAIIAPLSLVGPCLTIRIFSKTPFRVEQLVDMKTLPQEMVPFLDACVKARKNIVVSGGTGSGKTTLLNVLSGFLPQGERILTIEDAAELRLGQQHVVSLEARPPNIEGRGAITIRDLVRNALRMRPDRIVVGECRGGEALDMLQAMNTGHEGSLTTVHANSPRDVVSRLETMVLMAGMGLPVRAIREQVGAAIHLIVQLSRFSDGTRKISKVTEVVGLEGDRITMQDIFRYRQDRVDTDGNVIGSFVPTGAVPTFLQEMQNRGITIDPAIFDGKKWVN